MFLPSGTSETLAQFFQIDLGIQDFLRVCDLFPGNFTFLLGRYARHDAGHRRFCAGFRLVMKLATGNAGDERFLLLGVSLLEIGSELSSGREILRSLIIRY